MSAADDRLRWVGTVYCEYGGPIIIANASDYEKWLGAAPYPLDQRKVLHYWGQFTADLPAPYAQDGGHVFKEFDTHSEAKAERDKLVAAIVEAFDGATPTIDDEDGSGHVLLPDNRQLWIQFSPQSAYEEACDAEFDVWEHEYTTPRGSEGRALFWEKEGGGSVFVATTEARDEIVLLRTYVNEDELQSTAKAYVDSPPDIEQLADDVTMTIGDRPVIVAYSPVNWLEIVGPDRLREITEGVSSPEEGRAKVHAAFAALLEPARDGSVALSADHAGKCGVALDLLAGSYQASIGHYDEEDDWSCLWCRLKRSGA